MSLLYSVDSNEIDLADFEDAENNNIDRGAGVNENQPTKADDHQPSGKCMEYIMLEIGFYMLDGLQHCYAHGFVFTTLLFRGWDSSSRRKRW